MSDSLKISELFEKLRHDDDFHIGLGDIRITIGQQEWIETIENSLQNRIAELEERIANISSIKYENQIKAEGILEMLSQFDMEEMADCEGQYLSVNLMYEYKRRLESKDG